MTTEQLALVAIVFVAVAATAMILLTRFSPNRVRQRLESVTDPAQAAPRGGAWRQKVVQAVAPFAKMSLPSEGWGASPLRVRFMNAGYRDENAVLLYFAAKTILALIPPGLLFLALRLSGASLSTNMTLLLLLATAAFGYYLPNLVLARLVFLRQRSIFENFPDAADLLLVCVESGLGLDAGMNKVAEEMRLKSKPLAEELHLVNLEIRAGSSRQKALHNLALRTGVEELNTFTTMLVQADRFGTSIGDSLRVFSEELRTRRRFRAEERAAKVPLKLLFPLVLFIFPALLLVLLGPAFIQMYRILVPAVTGQG